MASPSVASFAETALANGTAHVCTLPSGIVSGDLLLVVAGMDQDDIDGWIDNTTWTEIFVDNRAGQEPTLGAAWRTATLTDGLTFSTAFAARGGAIVYRITGAIDPLTQAPEAPTATGGSPSTAPDPPDFSPTGGSKDYLWFAVCSHDDGDVTVDSADSAYSNLQEVSELGSSGAGVGVAERELTASSENPDAFTLSASQEWGANTIAVHPVAAGGNAPTGHLLGPLHGPLSGPIAV